MRFLVVGASGFIGSRLSRELAKRFGIANVQLIVPPFDRRPNEQLRRQSLEDAGFDVVKYDIMSNPPDLLKQIKPFDVLFHLATFAETESDDKELDQVNDVGTDRLLEKLKPLLVNKRVVFTSSLAAVDRERPDSTPQDEEVCLCAPNSLRAVQASRRVHPQAVCGGNAIRVDDSPSPDRVRARIPTWWII